MNLRPRPAEPAELNLTPLVDVVFLLLLFFMVSTTFERQPELPIALPEAEGQPASDRERDPIVVSIDRESRYVIAEQPVRAPSEEALSASLTQALSGALADHRAEASLLIEADAQTPHQAVMRILDVAQQLGLQRLAFAVRPPTAASVRNDEQHASATAETPEAAATADAPQ